MNLEHFKKKSESLLLSFLREPGGFSFFPSSFFWTNGIDESFLKKSFVSFFDSQDFNLVDQDNKLNLYIHIPFCTKICSYCNCFKEPLIQNNQIDLYIDYLRKETELIYLLNYSKKIQINSIFIGWWTPNLLSVYQLEKLYFIISQYFDLTYLEEFLLDGHPNYYTKDKMDYLSKIWVSRVTFAVQSFDNTTLNENNRDTYNKDLFEKNICYLKEKGIKTNIDLLIWIKWQTFSSVVNDIEYLKFLPVSNVSVHYFMKSYTIDYEPANDYLELVSQTKQYLKNNQLAYFSSNITEDYYASKRNSTIALWATSVTNIYSRWIYIKPAVNDYYKMLNEGILPYFRGMQLSKKDEMIRYVYLNILYWVNIEIFKKLFSEDIFRVFSFEFKFLNSSGILSFKNNTIYSNTNDLKTLVYFNILFLEKFSKIKFNTYNQGKLNNFFLDSWELIDK